MSHLLCQLGTLLIALMDIHFPFTVKKIDEYFDFFLILHMYAPIIQMVRSKQAFDRLYKRNQLEATNLIETQ